MQAAWRLLAVLIILLATGCQMSPTPSDDLLTQAQAIEAAVKAAKESRPEMSGAQVEPSNVQAELLTLAEAVKRLRTEGEPARGYDPQMPVWLVTMDGVWYDEFQAPDVTEVVTPEPYRHFMLILDAKTGLVIESAARP